MNPVGLLRFEKIWFNKIARFFLILKIGEVVLMN